MYYVYALYNKLSDKIYIGQTNNLARIILEHNNKNIHYTGKIVGQWELFYNEESASRSAAMAREKQLKSYRGREFLKTQLNNPG